MAILRQLRKALVALAAVAAVVAVLPTAPAQAVSGERAAMLFPFDNGGKTWIAGHGPDVHPHYVNAWSMDLHNTPGTSVKARFQTNDGVITMTVGSISNTCAAPVNGGKSVAVNIRVDGVFAGEAIYGHLDMDGVNLSVGQPIDSGTVLGRLKLWDQSYCWADTLGDGLVHTHVEVERGCYRSLAAWTNYGAGVPVGMVASGYGSTNVSVCNDAEVNGLLSGSAPPPSGSGVRLVGDFNGDNLDDAAVMFVSSGVAKVALSNGSSFGYPGDWSYGHSPGAQYLTGDVNGDGRSDLVAYYNTTHKWFVSLSSGSGFWSPTEWAYDGSLRPDRAFLADVTGDGKDDKVMFIGGNWYVSVSSGSGFWAPQAWITGHGVGSTDQKVGDFNGDGKADAAIWVGANGKWYVALSYGSYFGYPGEWSAGHGVGTSFRLVGDTTGDGKSDIAYYSGGNHKWYVGASAGGGFWSPAEWSYDGPSYAASDTDLLGDVNGDGKADKIRWYRNTGNWFVGTSSGGGFWPLQLWITGHGAGS